LNFFHGIPFKLKPAEPDSGSVNPSNRQQKRTRDQKAPRLSLQANNDVSDPGRNDPDDEQKWRGNSHDPIPFWVDVDGSHG
jgi:hypothetical protein